MQNKLFLDKYYVNQKILKITNIHFKTSNSDFERLLSIFIGTIR
jgi:hypothetical protein